MTAAIAGLGSGALHALSGPDHLLSLAPLSVGRSRAAWRVGSTAAMAALTSALAALSRSGRLTPSLARRIPAAASLASIAMGAWWAAAG